MSSANHSSVLERFLDPVTDCLTPEVAERIVNLRLDPGLQARLDDLAAKSSRGALSQDEQREYQEYVEGIDIVGILKAKARLSVCKKNRIV